MSVILIVANEQIRTLLEFDHSGEQADSHFLRNSIVANKANESMLERVRAQASLATDRRTMAGSAELPFDLRFYLHFPGILYNEIK